MKNKATDIVNAIICKKSAKINSISLFENEGIGESLCVYYGSLLIENNIYNNYLVNVFKNLQSIIESSTDITYTFCSGLTGLGWLLQHLSTKNNIIEKVEIESFLTEIDHVAFNSAIIDLDKNNHDFLHGAVGNAIYLIDRHRNNKSVHDYLKKLLHKFNLTSQKNELGIYWVDNSYHKYDKDKLIINLGLSHGLASKIVLFSKLLEYNIEKELNLHLLLNSVNFMLSCKNQDGTFSIFPDRIINGVYTGSSRLAWCYGDLGIASSLWQAGKTLENEVWKQEAITIMLHASKRRDLKENGIADAGLCHGTAGIAHIFNRFYWETKNPIFKETANYWIDKTLKFAYHKDGLMGFKTWRGELGWTNEHGLLEGIAGIGLALLSHLSDEEPTWDKCLLLS